ncbi:hypothetical protein DL96DRAFT_1585808 [Flagelloscypha sp. PMI_526]|nr:hypothetical protein DL96DRAFT_1585808 [Flagelloscypha sp. PMI_526]
MVPSFLQNIRHNLPLILVTLSIAVLDVCLFLAFQPLPSSGDSTSVQLVVRVVVEVLTYGSWGFVVLVPLAFVAHRGLVAGIRLTRFYQNVVRNLEDSRVEALLPSQFESQTTTRWILWGVWGIVLFGQGLVGLFILRSPSKATGSAFVDVLAVHARYLGLIAAAAIVLPFTSLGSLFASTAVLFQRRTDEEFRFTLGGISRIFQRIFFSLLVYLIVLDVCALTFDTQSIFYTISKVQINVLAFLNLGIGCASLFGVTFTLLAEWLAGWADGVSQVQEKPSPCRAKPYFLPALSFTAIPLAMVLAATTSLWSDGSSFGAIVVGLVPVAISVASGIVIFGLDILLCASVIFIRQRFGGNSLHRRLPQQDPDNEENIGLVEAAASVPSVLITSEEDGDSRFVLDEGDGDDSDEENSDEGEFEPLLDS